MIKASELRIGNYCHDIYSKEVLVVSDLSNDGPVGFEVFNISKYPLPDGWQAAYIPLTHEWLERLGFEKNGNWRYGKLNLISDDSDAPGICEVFRIEFAGELWLIEHVHQLQNLYFALTGEELQLKNI